VVNGVEQKQILTDRLSPTTVDVKTAQGVTVHVTGINFQIFSSDTVTITMAVRKGTTFLKQCGVSIYLSKVLRLLGKSERFCRLKNYRRLRHGI
jgi:hypothetical protein